MKTMKSLSKLYFLLSTLICTYLISCATPQKTRDEQKNKPSLKVKSSETSTQQQSSKKKVVKAATPTIDPYALLQKMMQENFKPTEIERSFLNILPPLPRSGSIHEALVVLSSLRENLKQNSTQANLNQLPTTETNGVEKIAPTVNKSVESILHANGVILEQVFDAQPALANSYVLKLLWNSSLEEGNSEVFRQRVVAIVKKLTTEWPIVLSSVHVEPIPVSQTTTSTVDEKSTPAVSADENNLERPVVNLDNQTLDAASNDSQSILPMKSITSSNFSKNVLEAQSFADKDDFQKAVQSTKSIPKDSAEYQSIKEQIVQWSNRGVIELRRKAANDFRTGQNNTNLSTKSSMFSKSRSNLLKALDEFPDATNLDTVRDNLRLVDQELEKTKQN
jgi:hypothetical protein